MSIGRLIETSAGSAASSPISLSAAGQDEQPWLVKSSMTARVCACAIDRVVAEAQTTTNTHARLRRTIPVSTPLLRSPLRPRAPGFLSVPAFTRHSLQGEAALRRHQLPQHVVQDSAVLEVIELVHGINPADQRNPLEPAIGRDDLGDHALARFDLAVQPADRHLLVAPEAERLPGGTLLKAQGQNAHTDQVGAVDALERLADHRPHALQVDALGGPVAR